MTLKDFKPMKGKGDTKKFYKYLWNALHEYRLEQGQKVYELCEELDISRETFYWIVKNRYISLTTILGMLLKIGADVRISAKGREIKLKYSTDVDKVYKESALYLVQKGKEILDVEDRSLVEYCAKRGITYSSVLRVLKTKIPQIDIAMAFAKMAGVKIDIIVNGKVFKA